MLQYQKDFTTFSINNNAFAATVIVKKSARQKLDRRKAQMTSLFTHDVNFKMAANCREVSFNGRDATPSKSPLLKKAGSIVLPKDEHVKKKRKINVEEDSKRQVVLENHTGKVRRLSSAEESWNITSVSSPSRSPSPTKTANSLKTTLKKIKKEGKRDFRGNVLLIIPTFNLSNV